MPRKLLRVSLASITVKSNGDLPVRGGKGKRKKKEEAEKNNAIIATLRYPRSGAPNVVSSVRCDLQSGEQHEFDTKDFWKSGLFKEEVQDETILRIQVTDRDEKSILEKGLRKVFATLLGAGLGAATSGISNVFLGAISKLTIATGTGKISGGEDERIHIIGEAEMRLRINRIPSTLELDLKAPTTIRKAYFAIPQAGGPVTRREVELTTKGQSNGVVVLTLRAEEV